MGIQNMNETRSPKLAPPRWIEAIVWLMPRSAANRSEDFKDYDNLPALQLVWKAAGTVCASSVTWIRRAFNLEPVLPESFVLSIPFWWTPVLPAVIAVTSAAVILRLRDSFANFRSPELWETVHVTHLSVFSFDGDTTVNLGHSRWKNRQLHLWHAFSYQPPATRATIFRLILISSISEKTPPRSGGLN